MSVESAAFAPSSRELCRLCLGNEAELLDIFGVHGGEHIDTEPLTVRIHGFLQLEILQGDTLPKWICKQCLDKIDDFTSFREQCKQNERKLRLGLPAGAGKTFPVDGVVLLEHDEDAPTDDEETEMIVIDPTQDYESSNQSLPNDDNEGENGNLCHSEAEAEYEGFNGSPADEAEEEDEEEEDFNCDTFPKDASNGLPHGGSTHASPQKTAVFTCKYCDVAFAASSDCQLHEMQDHDLLAPYACLYCGYKTAIRLSLIAHIREQHQITRPYICMQCKKGFPRRSDLKKHTFVHTGVRPFACDQCGKSFSRNTNLTKHMRTHSGVKPHTCDICPRSFANRADLVRHHKIHSGLGSQFSCTRCGNTYARKDKLSTHERVCFRMLQNVDAPGSGPFGGGLLPPSKPEISFGLLLSPQKIPETVLMENPAPSELLPAPTMVNFENVVTQPAPPLFSPSPPSSKIYNCTECPKRFLSKASLRVHQATHASEDTRSYECPQCQKHCVGKREIERHLMTHTIMKPFGCKTCGRKFSRQDKLRRHERMHQRERSFPCPNCAVKFEGADDLATHLKMHCSPASMGSINYLAPTMAPSSAPFAAIGQEQLTQLPHEHSMLYMVGDDTAVIGSGRM
uniref:Protein krueppel n=1 Tax=Anopheles atroparvus TaxID=41427 RepID=A0AAG5DBE7_ANOAO